MRHFVEQELLRRAQLHRKELVNEGAIDLGSANHRKHRGCGRKAMLPIIEQRFLDRNGRNGIPSKRRWEEE
jgi:hypothetical protein